MGRRPNPRKQEIINYVAIEIAQHRDGELDVFTSTEELTNLFGIKSRSLNEYIKNSSISREDRDYKKFHLRSQANSRENNPYYGKSHSEETRRKISSSQLGEKGKKEMRNLVNHVALEIEQHRAGKIDRFSTPQELSHLYGISRSRIFKYLKNSDITHSELRYRTNYLASQVQTGEKNPNYGRSHSIEIRKKISQINKGRVHSESTRKKMSKSRRGLRHSEKTKRKLSKLMAGKNNPMHGRTGKNHPNWQGGTSFLPYSPEFELVMRPYIRERDEHTCQFCDAEQNGKAHCVHHIDHDKDNNSEQNLITLCELCHNNESTSPKDLRAEWIDWCNQKVDETYQTLTYERLAELMDLRMTLEERLD
ncbi:hypothetical protein HOD75_03490 [archaeon]|jgi:hypothetical protein|nr:hypothetical protein [archaeon]MBT4241937.1 hypothetical protein [archaeon]MBT4418484.1 hypothetical protein [archaeon]